MMTVHEISRLAGVSIRTLRYYDHIGLLPPQTRTEAGYRLYDDAALEALQQILLFRAIEFPLKDIKRMMQCPAFNKQQALKQQITLLEMKIAHLNSLLVLARDIEQAKGGTLMDFSAFDTKKIDEYARQAKAAWGDTDAYKEYEQKSQDRSKEDSRALTRQLMRIFTQLGEMKSLRPEDAPVQSLIKALQDFITAHYYTCTKEILSGLGRMYAAGGEMTDSIDRAGGPGTAEFAGEAIRIYCAE